MIVDMLNDEINYLFFILVSPIATEFKRITALFQASDADHENLVKDITFHYYSLHNVDTTYISNPKL